MPDISTQIKRGKFWLRLDRAAPRGLSMAEQEAWRQQEHECYLAEFRAVYDPPIAIYRKRADGTYGVAGL